MDLLILLAVFVALLALAYVTYRNISNLDSRLRRIEDILKNAQVVAEPVHLPPSTGFAAANVSTNPSVARPIPSRSPSAPKTITHFQPSQSGSGSGSGFGVPGWGGESAPSVPVHVERVAEPEFDESVSVGDNVDGDVSLDDQGDVEIDEEAENTHVEGVGDISNKEVDVDNDEEIVDEDEEVVDEDSTDKKVVDEEVSVEEIVDDVLSAEDKATRTIQVDADFDDSELTLDDILSNMEQENLRSAPVPAQPQAQQVQRNYDELKVVEIREILRRANVSIPANAKKSEMIALMKQRGL